MNRLCSILLCIALLGCVWVATAQTSVVTEQATQKINYCLPFVKIGGENALITITNPHQRDVGVTVTVEDQSAVRLDDLSDSLAPNEARSFPTSSLPPNSNQLCVEADARIQVGLVYTLDGKTFDTRLVEPELETLAGTVPAAEDEPEGIPKVAAARSAVVTTYGSTCGGQTSVGNPYPCGNGGNCTWWAWKMAKDSWGIALPGWSDARTWAASARNSNFRVSATPAPQTIGVNTTMAGGLGHVFWVTSVNGTQVCGTEMLWGSYGLRSNCYSTSTFNAGFIYPPSLTVVSPNGYETWTRGMRATISWQAAGNPGPYVSLELVSQLLLQGSQVVYPIASGVPRGQVAGSYTWQVPYWIPVGSLYFVRVTSTNNPRYTDTSNWYFTIR